jgi:hypothetical protein
MYRGNHNTAKSGKISTRTKDNIGDRISLSMTDKKGCNAIAIG